MPGAMRVPERLFLAGLLSAVAFGLLASCDIGQTGGGGQAIRQSIAVPGWGGQKIHGVCVEGAATFEGQPANEEAVRMLGEGLKRWGITKVRPGGACDATMRMEFTGTANSATYTGGRVLYTGFTISGQKTLSAPNLPTLTHPFTSSEIPPVGVAGGPTTPQAALPTVVDAHYDDCLPPGSDHEDGCHAMANFFGPFKGQPAPIKGA
jgi:hypothetical protein